MKEKISKIKLSELGITNNRDLNKSFSLNSTTATHEIQDIIRYISDGQIKLPDIQRPAGAWGVKMEEDFIDSIINGYPIPPLMIVRADTTKLLIDGHQRIHTIKKFIDGEIKTRLNDDAPNISRKNFNQLPEKFQKRFEQCELLVQYVSANGSSDMSFIFEIFRRINTASVKLTNIQVAFATFYGDFTKWLKDFCETLDDVIMKYTSSKTPDLKAEIVLRMITFHLIFDFKDQNLLSYFGKKTITSNDLISVPLERFWKLCGEDLEIAKTAIKEFYYGVLVEIKNIGVENLFSINASMKRTDKIQLPTLDAFVILMSEKEKLEHFKTLQEKIKFEIRGKGFYNIKKIFQEQTLKKESIKDRIDYIISEKNV